jgi:hypothetical protein
MRLATGKILQDVPDPAAVFMTMQLRMTAQPGFQFSNPVPRWTKE